MKDKKFDDNEEDIIQKQKRVFEKFKDSPPNAQGALADYFKLFSSNLDKFRLAPSNGATDFGQQVVDSIEQFSPDRNELVKVFDLIATHETRYDKTTTSALAIHKFFKSLLEYIPASSSHTRNYDNFKFIAHESFLLCITIFLKYDKFELVEYLLKNRYYTRKSEMKSFTVFRNHLGSLKNMKTGQDLDRLSLHADILKDGCTDSGIPFEYMMQADFLLYLAGAIQEVKVKDKYYKAWWPETLVFKANSNAFEIFLNSESTEYFNRLACTLDIKSKKDLEPFVEGIKTGEVDIPRWGSDRIEPLRLMNYEKLCSA